MSGGIEINAVNDLIGASDLVLVGRRKNGGVVTDPDQHLGKRAAAATQVSKKRLFHRSVFARMVIPQAAARWERSRVK
jgi:hypothetical protein